ncbi:hypothetical protein SELMODRAFT_408269 [Selaginella moellendorffii]|uniref:Uncharacterized protein n=1 Tax=Selaginella moellendorffii TaxID=88036 RepID=D8R7R8_SELML|nr:hypothetical protein SELMODRAFT_408269 [Selaginella moellendorffii]
MVKVKIVKDGPKERDALAPKKPVVMKKPLAMELDEAKIKDHVHVSVPSETMTSRTILKQQQAMELNKELAPEIRDPVSIPSKTMASRTISSNSATISGSSKTNSTKVKEGMIRDPPKLKRFTDYIQFGDEAPRCRLTAPKRNLRIEIP